MNKCSGCGAETVGNYSSIVSERKQYDQFWHVFEHLQMEHEFLKDSLEKKVNELITIQKVNEKQKVPSRRSAPRTMAKRKARL